MRADLRKGDQDPARILGGEGPSHSGAWAGWWGRGLAHRLPHPASPEQQLKKTVDELQAKLALAKGEYKTALRNLETISDEIHERRRSGAMGPRGRGVGAEGGAVPAEGLAGRKPEADTVSGESGAPCPPRAGHRSQGRS